VRAAAASLIAILGAGLAFAASASPGARGRHRTVTSAYGPRAPSAYGPRAPTAYGPRGATYFPGTDTWYEIQRGHLVVGRTGMPQWRSRGLFPGSRFRFGVVAAGRQGVAFSYRGWLYIAKRGGAERRVARREAAVGWTTDGVYTYGTTLLLRSATGRRMTTVARRPQQHAYDPATGSLYLVDDGELTVATGARVHPVTSLRALNLPPRATELIPLGGLIEFESANRIVVLRPNGAMFASTNVPRDATISSGLAVAPGDTAIAFTAAKGLSEDPNTTRRAHGTETVYLLRPGSRKAVPIHTAHVTFEPCERGATVTWHGSQVRYSNSEGNRATIRTRI
jgi:hypothetical protein